MDTTKIDATLEQRGSKYGAFSDNAQVTQSALKCVLDQAEAMDRNLSYEDKEALHMILHKMSRVVCGTGQVKDNWHDIIGYAELARKVHGLSKLDQIDTPQVSNVFINDLQSIYFNKRALRDYEVEALNTLFVAISLIACYSSYTDAAYASIMKNSQIAEDITVDE